MKREEPCKDDPARGTQAYEQKKWVLLTVSEEWVTRKVGTLPPFREMARAAGDTHRA